MKIPDNVMDVLNESTITNGVLMLPSGQLERKHYEAVNKCLEAMGGKWNRNAKGHVFDRDPSDLLENALRTGGVIDAKKEFQLFETPHELAARMVKAAGLMAGCRILEPSAGHGNIVRAIFDAATGADCCSVTAIELNQVAIKRLEEQRQKTVYANSSNFDIHHSDFLQCGAELGQFHYVVMNPPFSRNQDIHHVRHAYTFLKPGGRLVAIMSEHAFFAKDAKSEAFREQFVKLPSCQTWKLPPETFKESGAGCSSRMIAIDRPRSR